MSAVKKVGIGAILVAAVWGGATWYIGSQSEARFNEILDSIAKNTPQVTIANRTFERGFLASKGSATFDFSPMLNELKDTMDKAEFEQLTKLAATLTLETSIQHGPVTAGGLNLALYEIRPVLTAEQRTEAQKLFGDKDPLTLKGSTSLTGTIAINGHIPDFSFTTTSEESGKPITVKVAATTFDAIGKSGSTITQTLSLPSITASEDGKGTFAIGPIQAKGVTDYNRVINDVLAAADVESTIGAITFQGPNGKMEINNFKLQTSLPINGEFADVKLNFTLDGIKFSDPDGSSADFGSFTLNYGIEHIAARPLSEFVRNVQQLQASGKAEDKQAMQQMILSSTSHLLEIATQNPALYINPIKVSSPKGDITFTARLTAPGLAQQDFAIPMMALAKVQIQADFNAPRAALQYYSELFAGKDASTERKAQAAKELQNSLMQAKQQNLITLEGDTVKASFRLESGAMTLNGQPTDPKALSQLTALLLSSDKDSEEEASEPAIDEEDEAAFDPSLHGGQPEGDM